MLVSTRVDKQAEYQTLQRACSLPYSPKETLAPHAALQSNLISQTSTSRPPPMSQSQPIKYPRIVVTPPGPKAREIVKEDHSLISQSLVRFYPLVAESGKGCIVKDVDGNEFIDFNSGLVCLAVGHAHPKVVAAIKAQ